ncbi:hypothetical protein MNBD_DELTA01-815 [hydrothermal vent metagenome]|uniref:Uncharacterized protein n=1 Tax=hydrothermal vent metagenome TaxID=652676 RepID=A0A3B0R0U0_9ZZZZ
MSFYAVVQTELTEKKFIMLALEEMQKRGEITSFRVNNKNDSIDVDRSGDKITIKLDAKTKQYQFAGDSRVVSSFSKRFTQIYALESIKDSLPLDFEIETEKEIGGEINLILKG